MDEISQIRQKIDIVSFISEYLPLKKVGRNFKVLCPFHTEKTPSFIVSPERQIWHCFGCGKGGDCFTFLMEYENLEFPEALEILAQRAGMTLTRRVFDSEISRKKQKLYEINHLASEFYHYLLTSHPAGKKALDYLKKRQITEGSIKTFKLGFVPNLWDTLLKYLVEKKKYSPQDLLTAGLIVKTEEGRFIDKFKNRVIFPLADQRGNIVGFSGRTLTEASGLSKYVNTPETPLYHKSELLYGLDITKGEIKKEDQVVVVEGEFDVIQSWQQGIKNVVAIKGTALTENQAKLITRFSENVRLCLDQDLAGELANKRSIEVLENANLSVSIVKLPAGQDPDSSLRENPALFKRAIKTPIPIYDFIIGLALSRWDAKEPVGKKKISSEVIPFLAKITNEIIKNHYVRRLAQELEVSEEAVLGEIAKIEKKEERGVVEEVRKDKRGREEILAEYLLALVIQSQNPGIFLPNISGVLKSKLLTSPVYQNIFQHLADFLKKKKFSIKEFIQVVPGQLVPTIDRSFLLLLPNNLVDEKYLFEVERTVGELRRFSLRQKIKETTEKIKLAEAEKNEQELSALKVNFGKLMKLVNLEDK